MANIFTNNYFTKRLFPATASTAVGPFVDAAGETVNAGKNAGTSWWAEAKNIGSDIAANFKDAGPLRWRAVPRTMGTIGYRLMNGFSDALRGTLEAGNNLLSRITRRTSANIFSLFNKNIAYAPIRSNASKPATPKS